MPPTAETPEALRRLLRQQRHATLDDLFRALGTCSRMTVFRRLKEVGYHSSYSHRGRYYTLEDIPRFDAHGLWFHENVGFSRFGTLKGTVAHMVPQTPAGSTHSELAALLRVRVQTPLRELVHAGAIGRQAVEGLGEFVYVSANLTEAAQQIARRLESLQVSEARALPPNETVLSILTETLRAGRERVAPERVAERLAARGQTVSAEEVKRVLEHYDLLDGKKNSSLPPTPSSP